MKLALGFAVRLSHNLLRRNFKDIANRIPAFGIHFSA